MRAQVASLFGVSGIAVAVLAIVSSVWAVNLPYRLSQSERMLLETFVLIQFAGLIFAVGFGSAALRGDVRSRQLGFVALALGAVIIAFMIFPSYVHSTSH